ncbi:MAG: TonB-dependent siderophore receptor [Lautropia sp.]|nr:TonB-dependent siderophore receptor [Lautropia sp.]
MRKKTVQTSVVAVLGWGLVAGAGAQQVAVAQVVAQVDDASGSVMESGRVPSAARREAGVSELDTVRVRASAEEPGYRLPEAGTATRVAVPLRDVPQTVNVLPQQLLRDQGVLSVQDAVRNVAGVGLSHGDGQRDQVTIRGFSAMSDQFVDGLRDDALYFRDLSNIEQLELVKGPAAVLYGRGSSGGLLNRITKKPGIDLSELVLTLGSRKQRRGEFDLARAPGDSDFSYRLTGALEKAESYRNQQFLDRKAVAPTVQWQPSAATRVLWQADYLSDRRLTDFGVPALNGRPVAVPAGTYYGAANGRDVDFSQARVASSTLTVEHTFGSGLMLRNALRYYDYSLDRHNTTPGRVNAAARTATLGRGAIARDEQGVFNQTELKGRAGWAGIEHQWLVGMELGRQRKDQQVHSGGSVGTVDLFNPVGPLLPLAIAGTPGTDNHGIFKVASLYVQDMLSLAPQWKALAGVRYDRFRQETHEHQAGKPDLSRTDKAWSPRVGVVYQPQADVSYYMSMSKSFQPSGEGFALSASNADIAPEETTAYEAGMKWDLSHRLSATASVFQARRTHIKATDPVTNRVQPLGTQRTRGAELSLSGRLPGGWESWVSYAYLDARITRSPAVSEGVAVQGKRATLTPRHAASAWLTRDIGHGFGVGGGVYAVGRRYANPSNTVVLPGYATVDAMAYYRRAAMDVQLRLGNLFDRAYYVSAHGFASNYNMPGAPRSVQLTLRYRF